MLDTNTATTNLLAEMGITLAPDGPAIDWPRAFRTHIHHSSLPVALAAYAMADAVLCKWLFPNMRLVDIVAKAPCMDGAEKAALAQLSDTSDTPQHFADWARVRAKFHIVLRETIEGWNLQGCFFDDGSALDHTAIRPFGHTPFAGLDQDARRKFHRSAAALPEVARMLVATIIGLYRGGVDRTWLDGRQWAWPAAKALGLLSQDREAMTAWLRLMAFYPGW